MSMVEPKPIYLPVRILSQSQTVIKPKQKPTKIPDYFRNSIENRSNNPLNKNMEQKVLCKRLEPCTKTGTIISKNG